MKNTALIILDGWGIGDGSATDGIAQSNTPYFDQLMANYPNSTLKTFGEHVGLPSGQMGNSEVGHLNIGAGRIVYQDLAKINREIDRNNVKNNATLKAAIEFAKSNGSAIHLMGLLSHGGVHSSQHHLHHIVDLIEASGHEKTFIHAFTDGRDVEQKSAKSNFKELSAHIVSKNTKIATVIGRFYAMDRDNRWDRIKVAYDLLVNRVGNSIGDFDAYCDKQYEHGITDEFFEAAYHRDVDGKIKSGDVVLCFNYRTDRCREITQALTQRDFSEHGMKKLFLHFVTMTRYDESFTNVNVMYDKENLRNTLGEVIAATGASQLRIAETEKYPHVTFFFSGGREKPFNGELRQVINSPKVSTYDLQPEMSAPEVASKFIEMIQTSKPNFICLNFANPDMVGHTGVESAIHKAVESVDSLLKKVVSEAIQNEYSCLIIADHGNADVMRNQDGSPHTAHTMNLVPCILVGKNRKLNNGILADVAPTILNLMEIDQPREMTGCNLLQ